MYTELLSAVKTLWDSSSSLSAAVPGGLYVNEVPENIGGATVSMPFAYVECPDTEFEYTMENTVMYFENASLEFCAFAPGAETTQDVLKQIRRVFDWAELPFPSDDLGTATVECRPRRASLKSEQIRDKEGRLIYRCHMAYSILLNRAHPLL